MIPVTQDQLYNQEDPDHRGNCWQAVIASVLELPLDEVPHFVQDDHDHEGDFEWDWWMRTVAFLQERGMGLYAGGDHARPGEYELVSGISPRAGGTIHHVVIYQDGAMVHDPHPDRTGLLSIVDSFVIRPIETET